MWPTQCGTQALWQRLSALGEGQGFVRAERKACATQAASLPLRFSKKLSSDRRGTLLFLFRLCFNEAIPSVQYACQALLGAEAVEGESSGCGVWM